MAITDFQPLVAVDIGNSRIKLGTFEPPLGEPLPLPARFAVFSPDWMNDDLERFLPGPPDEYAWSISSVNRPSTARLTQWLESRGTTRVRCLTHLDLPLTIDLERPERVGLDRLVNAVATNRLRANDQAAIVIDVGSALKVDLVSAKGAFAGGAIMPGMAMAARALHEFTDLLPLVEVDEPPPALGTSTLGAIRSGLYWGAVGAVRELVERLADEHRVAEFYLTGGAAPGFAAHLDREEGGRIKFVPHLTLSGIALSTARAAPAEGSR